MNNKVYCDYDIYEIEKKLERTYVKASEFFDINDLLIEKFDRALKALTNQTEAA